MEKLGEDGEYVSFKTTTAWRDKSLSDEERQYVKLDYARIQKRLLQLYRNRKAIQPAEEQFYGEKIVLRSILENIKYLEKNWSLFYDFIRERSGDHSLSEEVVVTWWSSYCLSDLVDGSLKVNVGNVVSRLNALLGIS